MNMNKQRLEYLKEVILEMLPQSRDKAVTTSALLQKTGIDVRALKNIISELRIEYPICSKEESPGGYWIADNDEDIMEFVGVMERRKRSYEKTVEVMSNHILDRRE